MFGTSSDLPRIVEINLQQIEANPDQPRKFFDDSGLLELAQSIESKGLLQPILIKEISDERYMIVAGERRYRATELISRKTIAAIITDGDVDEVAIIENVQRENLRPIELADSLARLMQTHGYTQEDAAQVIGKSRSTVTELLSLLKLPDHIKEHCRTYDNVSKSFLIELARMDEASMLAAWEDVKANGDSSVRSARERKTGTKSAKAPETLFTKIEKALWLAVKTTKGAIEKITPDERNQLVEIKKHLDTLLNETQEVAPSLQD